MSVFAETAFNPRPCRRCGRLVLAGTHAGLRWRLDLGVAAMDGRVLHRYGHGIIVLINSATGLLAADYDPGHDLPPGGYLAAAHICGSAHSLQRAST